MPCRVDVLKSYVSGKKFTKLKAHHDFDFSRLEPFLIPSKKRKYDDYWSTLKLFDFFYPPPPPVFLLIKVSVVLCTDEPLCES